MWWARRALRVCERRGSGGEGRLQRYRRRTACRRAGGLVERKRVVREEGEKSAEKVVKKLRRVTASSEVERIESRRDFRMVGSVQD